MRHFFIKKVVNWCEKEQKYDKIIGSYESLEMPCPAKCLSFIKVVNWCIEKNIRDIYEDFEED